MVAVPLVVSDGVLSPVVKAEQKVFDSFSADFEELEIWKEFLSSLTDCLKKEVASRSVRPADAVKEILFFRNCVKIVENQIAAHFASLLASPNSVVADGTFADFKFVVKNCFDVRAAGYLLKRGLWTKSVVVCHRRTDMMMVAEGLVWGITVTEV